MADKKHKVVIVFSGEVALGPPLPSTLPPDPKDPITEKGPLFGVMPLSGRRSVTFLDESGAEVTGFSGVHLPVIFTNLESDGRTEDDQIGTFRIWYPLRERMQIVVNGDETPGVLTYVHDRDYGKAGKLGDPDPATGALANPIEDFAAIPDLGTVSPDRSTLRAGMLDEDAKDVGAQVFVPSGTLRSGSHDGRRFGHLVAYGPAGSRRQPRNAVVVPQVRITVDVDELLTIRTWSLDTGSELDPLKFVVDKNAELWIGNIDPDEVRSIIEDLDTSHPFRAMRRFIEDVVGPAANANRAIERCDVDFARFYELTDGTGDMVVPCDVNPAAGERKCYTVTVKKGGP